jgi:hypothetical protein
MGRNTLPRQCPVRPANQSSNLTGLSRQVLELGFRIREEICWKNGRRSVLNISSFTLSWHKRGRQDAVSILSRCLSFRWHPSGGKT